MGDRHGRHCSPRPASYRDRPRVARGKWRIGSVPALLVDRWSSAWVWSAGGAGTRRLGSRSRNGRPARDRRSVRAGAPAHAHRPLLPSVRSRSIAGRDGQTPRLSRAHADCSRPGPKKRRPRRGKWPRAQPRVSGSGDRFCRRRSARSIRCSAFPPWGAPRIRR